MRVTWQVEFDPYCTAVLAKHWPGVQRYGDIKSIDWSTVTPVDLVCGGFPCQPFSLAGQRRGTADDRYLWPEVVRCLDALRPAWFLGENVPGLVKLALDQVCADLEDLDYTVWPVSLPACAFDAPHIRQRIWILAYSERRRRGQGREGRELEAMDRGGQDNTGAAQESGHVADADSDNEHGRGRAVQMGRERSKGEAAADGHAYRTQWATEPRLGLLADGLSSGLVRWDREPQGVPRTATGIQDRTERLKGLGNAIVPQIAEQLGRWIQQVTNQAWEQPSG